MGKRERGGDGRARAHPCCAPVVGDGRIGDRTGCAGTRHVPTRGSAREPTSSWSDRAASARSAARCWARSARTSSTTRRARSSSCAPARTSEPGRRSTRLIEAALRLLAAVEEVDDGLGTGGRVLEQEEVATRTPHDPRVGDARGEDAAVERGHHPIRVTGQHEHGRADMMEPRQARPSGARRQLAGVPPQAREAERVARRSADGGAGRPRRHRRRTGTAR